MIAENTIKLFNFAHIAPKGYCALSTVRRAFNLSPSFLLLC